MREIRVSKLLLALSIVSATALGSGADRAAADELANLAPAQNLSSVAPPPGRLTRLTVTANGHSVHVFPTVQRHTALAKGFADNGPLLYHSGGAIMPYAYLYAIFWLPSSGKLQNGQPTSLPFSYQSLEATFLNDYARHSIGTIATQYFQTIGSTTTYVGDAGGLGGFALDTSPYPAPGCTDSYTPGNCITDAQIQAEIAKVMAAKGWTGGLNKIFILYTSSGEGSCIDSSSGICAYTYYCAYHGSFTSGSTPVVYANMPFGNLSVCQVNGTPSPNGNAEADAVIDIASHEITEAITDPLLNAWFTAQGNEIGDLCNFNYGPNTWDAGKANQSWNGHFYEVQMEYDNHALSCSQAGPL
jgi:hypothetical protein